MAFSKPKPGLSKAVLQALFVIAISTFSSTAAVSGFDEGVASYRVGNYADAFKEWSEAARHGMSTPSTTLDVFMFAAKACRRIERGPLTGFNEQPIRGTSMPQPGSSFRNSVTDDRRKEFFSRRLKPTDRFRLTFVVQLSDGKIHQRPCSTDEKEGAKIEFDLGLKYETGTAGFPQDDKQAAEWYRRASERNFADAQTKLAYLYAAGRGVEQSQIEAARLFRRAAEQGNSIAQTNLGVIYASGSIGHAKDLVLAYVLVSHAADMGKPIALNELPKIAALLSQDQLLEGRRLAEKWKGNVRWPPEIAERLGPPN